MYRWVPVQLLNARPPALVIVAVPASVSPVSGDDADADAAVPANAATTATTGVNASRIRRRLLE
jgi:hypothetical protein